MHPNKKALPNHPGIITFCFRIFSKLQIKEGPKLLFDGYDGVEFGLLSKDMDIPTWFRKSTFRKYAWYQKNGSCKPLKMNSDSFVIIVKSIVTGNLNIH